jgi:tripeptide aminopeptidase
MINTERLADTFSSLVRIDSISREEKEVSIVLQKILKDLGGEIFIDNAGEKLGGNTGNLVAKFKGTVAVPPLMLCGHMDTVEPGKGIEPVLDNGIFRSVGDTILGSDDKSALAIIIEVMRVLKENKLPHGPIEVVFTICEEAGLLGAKHFDVSLIDSKMGYILDATDKEGIFTRAPFASRFKITFNGKAAHSGASPEKGVSAVVLASRMISALTWGRIDHETTCNVGKITGGVATNIIPEQAVLLGEVRSHSKEKLDDVIRDITVTSERVVAEARVTSPDSKLPTVDIQFEEDFPGTNIPEDHPVVVLAKQAAARIGMGMESKTTGGGADANIFFGKGIVCGVLGTGMTDVHTLHENIALSDMVSSAELLLAIIELHNKSQSC